MSTNNQMTAVERDRKILDSLTDQTKVTVSDLATSLHVSETTVRRDLRRLAARQLIQRVHGGAMRLNMLGLEPPVLKRAAEQAEEKHRISQVAVSLVNDGDTVTLIGGSTTLQVASHLSNKKKLTVITDSLLIGYNIAKQPNIDLILLGGAVEHSELSVGGNLTLLCLEELRAHKVIFGVRAVNFTHGLMLDRVSEAATFRACMKAADEAILVVDYSKFGQVATAVLGPLTSVNRIVTDTGVPREILGRVRDLGIEVILA